MSEKMELADDISTRDAMREMGQLSDPVQETLRGMLHEFGDEHYHTCPADNDSGPCDCFAGNLIIKAKAALLAALRASPAEGEAVAKVFSGSIGFHIDWLPETPPKNGQFLYTAPPRAAVSPPRREEIAKLVYDAFPFEQRHGLAQKPEWVPNGSSTMQDQARSAAEAILALYPAGDGREADSLSGEKGKPE